MSNPTSNPTRYAIVISHGRYGSGDRVIAALVTADKARALKLAARMTREFRVGMARYGGSSGGYRVVATTARRATQTHWLGHDLDREPSITA